MEVTGAVAVDTVAAVTAVVIQHRMEVPEAAPRAAGASGTARGAHLLLAVVATEDHLLTGMVAAPHHLCLRTPEVEAMEGTGAVLHQLCTVDTVSLASLCQGLS